MSLVSVIMPVYNAEKYLEATLSCILSQSYSNLEVILVNDASKDNSYQICQRYARQDERIILINHEKAIISVLLTVMILLKKTQLKKYCLRHSAGM